MKCKFRLTVETGSVILEMPQEDWFAGHLAMLEAYGIRDKGPVPDSLTAEAVAKRALKRYQAIAAQAAESGKNSERKRR